MATRILIVEDHPTMREAMRLVLEGEGFDIDEAADGHLAMERIRLAPPDLLFLDLNIPGASGAEVLHAVKTDPATAAIRVIVVTATGEEGRATALLRTVERVLAAGESPEA